jgi:hypothetical protein
MIYRLDLALKVVNEASRSLRFPALIGQLNGYSDHSSLDGQEAAIAAAFGARPRARAQFQRRSPFGQSCLSQRVDP